MTDQKVVVRLRKEKLQRRRKHIHKRISGSAERPRLVVFRSSRHIYAQLKDDDNMRTITGCSTRSPALRSEIGKLSGKIEQASLVGRHIAELAKDKNIKTVTFDRNGCKYHGRIKALADGARESGLNF